MLRVKSVWGFPLLLVKHHRGYIWDHNSALRGEKENHFAPSLLLPTGGGFLSSLLLPMKSIDSQSCCEYLSPITWLDCGRYIPTTFCHLQCFCLLQPQAEVHLNHSSVIRDPCLSGARRGPAPWRSARVCTIHPAPGWCLDRETPTGSLGVSSARGRDAVGWCLLPASGWPCPETVPGRWSLLPAPRCSGVELPWARGSQPGPCPSLSAWAR